MHVTCHMICIHNIIIIQLKVTKRLIPPVGVTAQCQPKKKASRFCANYIHVHWQCNHLGVPIAAHRSVGSTQPVSHSGELMLTCCPANYGYQMRNYMYNVSELFSTSGEIGKHCKCKQLESLVGYLYPQPCLQGRMFRQVVSKEDD